MRQDVKKYLFIGFKDDRAAFFEQAQNLGIIHFIEKESKSKLFPTDIQNFVSVLKIVRGLPSLAQEELEESSTPENLLRQIITLHERVEKLEEEERLIEREREDVAAFGDFSWNRVREIEKQTRRKLQFYFAKSQWVDSSTIPEPFIYVGSESGLDYFIAFNQKPQQYPKFQEMAVVHSSGELKLLLREKVALRKKSEQELKLYAKYSNSLHRAFIDKLNDHQLHHTEEQVDLAADGNLFIIEGFVPVTKIALLDQLGKDLPIYVEEVACNETDRIPTYLENQGVAQIGEDLVHVYDTPSSTDKDPSLWVLFFFALFFALIIGDAGYGLIFLLAALIVKTKYRLSSLGKRLTTLLAILGAATLTWGILSNAFFGMSVDLDSPLRKFSLIHWLVEKKSAYHIAAHDDVWESWVAVYPSLTTVQDPLQFLKGGELIYDKFADNVLFELALFIGVIHISISILRNLYRNKLGFGWLIFIIGCYLYFPSYLKATSLIHYVFGLNKNLAPQIGLVLMIAGSSLATFLSLIKNRLSGLMEPMFGIQIFSDVMSYLRLYALALSGAMMAGVVNEFAGSVPLIFGAVIALLGHGLNILLSIMSGLIHGLRLNYLEWYHYSFEGDGKRFHALQKLKSD